MAQITRRFFGASCRRANSVSASATEACSELLRRFGNKPISVRSQLLDANQAHLLSVTLGRSPTTSIAPPHGTPIPPGHHLVYFTPSIEEQELGADGTDRTVNPISPFTRRMWAGGELEWDQRPEKLLRVGQVVQETTRLLTAEPKRLRSGGDMLLVGVEKIIENDAGVALVDRRSWVFQEKVLQAKQPAPRPDEVAFPEGAHTRDLCQTDVTLFRFSALTFNGHKIHYSPEWCREVEGHRTSVVHGPLNLINMLDFWRDTASNGTNEVVPKSIQYRAIRPLYANDRYRIILDTAGLEQDGMWKAEIWDSFGSVAMKGTIL